MTKTAAKAKPALIALTLGLLLSTTSVITAAEAATIKNGVACKKLGQKTKTGKKSYVCGKNPYVTPTKLTWMLLVALRHMIYMLKQRINTGFLRIFSLAPLKELQSLGIFKRVWTL